MGDVADWLHVNNPNMDVKCIADSPDFIAPEVHGVDCPKREPGYQAALQDFWQREVDHRRHPCRGMERGHGCPHCSGCWYTPWWKAWVLESQLLPSRPREH